MRRIIFVCLIALTNVCTYAQVKNKEQDCIHQHYENSKATVPNCETIHNISNKKIADMRAVTGKLSFKLNGVAYTAIESTVSCHTYTNSNATISISIKATINDSSQIVFSYRVPKKRGVVGTSVTPKPFVSYEKFYISINNKPYSNNFGLDLVNTTFTTNIKCAYKYGNDYLLLNGSFAGELKDKEGNIVKITEGIFLTKKIDNEDLLDK